LDILRPTVREDGAELWCSWNPKLQPDPAKPFNSVDGLFGQHLDDPLQQQIWIASLPGGGLLAKCNYDDNPWLPDDLYAEQKHAKLHRTPEDYAHIWRGAYQTRSEARVFSNWRVEYFDTPLQHRQLIFLHGADFGYSIDPSVLVRCWTARQEGGAYIPDPAGKFLMLDKEAYRVGLEIDHTPDFFKAHVPGCEQWTIVADSARPETISYCVRHGLSRMVSARKGKDSVVEGIEFIKNFTVVIHASCVHTIDEFTFYSWKQDPKTLVILPVLQDKKNHVIDAVRYAVEERRRPRGFFSV
jgi:phage terminase large subunit